MTVGITASRPRSSSSARFLARLVAPIAVVAALSLTGCTFIAENATLNRYDPTDGVGADLGNVLLRNVQAVTNEDGSLANIAFVAVNNGDQVRLHYSVETTGGQIDDSITLPPGSTLVGEQTPHLIIVKKPAAKVGGLLDVTFQAGDADSGLLQVPVLDVTGRPWLKPLVP